MEHRFGENALSVLRDIESVLLEKLTDAELQEKANSILQIYTSLSTKWTVQLHVFRDMTAKREPRHMDDILSAVVQIRLFSAFPEVNKKRSIPYSHGHVVRLLFCYTIIC